jgi:nonsense-mediated mRNA decay protein 3
MVQVHHSLGGMGPVVLCTHVTSAVHMLDPMTLRQVHVDSNAYWRAPYTAMLSFKQLVEYVVLDTELLGPTLGRWALADVQVHLANTSLKPLPCRKHPARCVKVSARALRFKG